MQRRAFLGAGGSLGLAALVGPLTGCAAEAHAFLLVPELEPIDASRPRVRYRPIQGIARGRGGLLAALLDMQRLAGVDGYVQVAVDSSGRGNGMTTVVTAYPVTYGNTPKALRIRVGRPRYDEPAASADPVPDEDPGPSTVAERLAKRRQARSTPAPTPAPDQP
jgi:hypothetical protein